MAYEKYTPGGKTKDLTSAPAMVQVVGVREGQEDAERNYRQARALQGWSA